MRHHPLFAKQPKSGERSNFSSLLLGKNVRVIRRHQLVADNHEVTKTAPAATSTGRVDPAERPHNPSSFEIFNPETDDLDSDEDSDDGEEDKSDDDEDCSGSCGGGEAEEESKKSSSATTSSSSPDSNDSVESVVSARTDTTDNTLHPSRHHQQPSQKTTPTSSSLSTPVKSTSLSPASSSPVPPILVAPPPPESNSLTMPLPPSDATAKTNVVPEEPKSGLVNCDPDNSNNLSGAVKGQLAAQRQSQSLDESESGADDFAVRAERRRKSLMSLLGENQTVISNIRSGMGGGGSAMSSRSGTLSHSFACLE